MTTSCKAITIVATLSGLALSVGPAHADTFCSANPPTSDAPSGYLVLTRSHDSVVVGVITGLGETRTHTMLSHGNGWFTHASMATPPTSSTEPHMGPTQLRYGAPGASQITTSATYQYLYGATNGGIDFISKQQGGTEGPTVANWFWSTMGYRWVGPTCGQTRGIQCTQSCVFVATTHGGGSTVCTWMGGSYYDCNGNLQTDNNCLSSGSHTPSTGPHAGMVGGGYYRLQENGADIPYSLHQFADIGQVNTGSAFAGGDGVVCSTLQAYGVNKALGRSLVPPVYTHALTAGAMTNFHDGVARACQNSDFGFIGGIVDFLSFGAVSAAKCNGAGNQGANCLVNPGWCGSSGDAGWWWSMRDNANVVARSISPDDISGWRSGEDYGDATSNGPWAPYGYDTLSFSGAGTTYSCWGN